MTNTLRVLESRVFLHYLIKISELRMEILDKKSNRMSRVIIGVSERSEFLKLQRILNFYSLRNLVSNELFFKNIYIGEFL